MSALAVTFGIAATLAHADDWKLSGFPAALLSGDGAQMTQHEIPQPPVSAIRAGDFPILLEKTVLADIQSQFGGDLHQAGDAGNSVYWLCYVSKADGRITRSWFISDGETGGSDHGVTMVASDTPEADTSGCAPAPAKLSAIDYSAPGLGSSFSDLRSRFGPLDLMDGAMSLDNQAPGTTAGSTRLQVLSYDFKGGKVGAVAVSQVTSN
jgi:hypothetical protein